MIGKVRSKNGEFLSETKTQFIWDGSHLVQEINHKTDRTFTYIYTHPDSYEPLAQCYKESENAQHTVNYFHCDQIGVPREMTDSQGKLLWKGRYDAWGQLIHDSNHHAQRTTHQPFRLQNQYFDQETGLHYNFLRYYEPALGRFITQDPIGLMGGMNLYRFEGTVQNQVDPLGLMVQVIAASWLLKGLAYVGTAMTGILIGVGIMEATEESEETNDIGKCPNKPKCPDDIYKKLNKDVHNAKNIVGKLGGCKPSMNKHDKAVRALAWKNLALSRSIREQTCWEGGDKNHQDQIADAWKNYYKCNGIN